MFVRVLSIGVALLAIVTGNMATAEPRPVIRWMLTGVPPKLIPDGPLRGTGYGEQQVALLMQHLPQFEQRLETVTPARLWHEMQAGGGVCSIDIADLPEREPWAIFSKHRTSVPGYRMLVLKERVADFAAFRDADGTIDLDRLATNDRLTGIYVASRHYTPRVNSFIDNPTRKTPLDSTRASTTIFEMVASRRGDFSFASVTEMNYFLALNETMPPDKRWPPLAMIAVKGGGEPVLGHIACSRDALGRQMIAAVDRLFEDETVWEAFLAPHRRWLAEVPLAAR